MAVAAVAALVHEAHASAAKRFTLPRADVALTIARDGSVRVAERISFRFEGQFTGAYRDVPLHAGQSIDRVSVAEGARQYRPGGCTALGCSDAAGTFGVERTAGRLRVVWHYRAANQTRTFTVSYRFQRLAVAYDDVVDVHVNVWGGEWAVPLDHLHAAAALPKALALSSPRYLVFGHPASRAGTTRSPGTATLDAATIPAHQAVELRVVVPRNSLASVAGAKVRRGNGLAKILAEERRR